MNDQRFYINGNPGTPHTRLDYRGRRWWLSLVDERGEGIGVRIRADQAHAIRDHFFHPDGTHRKGGTDRIVHT